MAIPLASIIGTSIKSFAKSKVMSFGKNKKSDNTQNTKPKESLVGTGRAIKPNNTVTALAIRPSSALVPETLKPTNALKSDNILLLIKGKVLSIEKFVSADFSIRKKINEKDRIKKEQSRFKKEEDKLERGINLPKFNIPIPGKGMFDNIMSRLIRFFGFILLGKLFPFLLKILPILKGILATITKVGSFFESIFGNLLNGFMSFVEWGYKIKENIKNIGKSLVGNNFETVLNNFESSLGTFMNLALIAGMASIDPDGSKSQGSTKIKGPKGVTGRSSRSGINSSVARRYTEKYGKEEAIKRFGKEGVESLGGKYARSGVTNFTRNALVGTLGKGGTKTLLKVVRPFAVKVPIIGGLIEFGLSWAMGEPVGRAAFKGVGTVLLGALGAAIGGPFGMFLGGWAGGEAGGALYDVIFGGKRSKGIATKSKGGTVPTREGRKVGGRVRRSSPKKPRIRKPLPIKIPTSPGKDVGGQKKIDALYGGNSSSGVIGSSKSGKSSIFSDYLDSAGWTPTGSSSNKSISGSNVLQNLSNIFKGIPFIGNWMGTAIDIALGQKPSALLYKNYSDNLGYFISNIVQDRVASSTSNIFGLISKLESGGTVTSSDSAIQNIQKELDTREIAKTISNLVKSDLDKALNIVRDASNIMMAKKESGDSSEYLDEGGGFSGGEYGGYAPTGMERKIYDYLINEKGLNDVQALGLMANIYRESSFRPNAREKGGTGHGLFQWSHSRVKPFIKAVPDWETNWKGQIDYALSEPQYLSLVKPGEYKGRKFKNAQEAADWWMVEWERPLDKISGSRKHAAYLKTVPRGKEGTAKFRYGSDENNIGTGKFNLGKGYGKKGQKIAGDLGDFMKMNNSKIPVLGSIHQHPRHPPFKKRSYDSLHNAGRAIDLGGWSPSSPQGGGKDEQAPIIRALLKWNREYGYSPVELIHASPAFRRIGSYRPYPDVHHHHVHVAYKKGGFTDKKPHIAMLGEEGREFVINAESTSAFEKIFPGFLTRLNKINLKDTNKISKNLTDEDSKDQISNNLRFKEPIANSQSNNISKFTSYENPGVNSSNIVFIPIPIPQPVSSGSGSKVSVPVKSGFTPKSNNISKLQNIHFRT